MDLKLFVDTSKNFFNKWLSDLNGYIKEGKINIPREYSFTDILRIAESPSHFICELYGSKRHRPGQIITVEVPNVAEEVENTNSFFSSRTPNTCSKAVIKIEADGCTLDGINLTTTKEDFDIIKKKLDLPILKSKVVVSYPEAEVSIIVEPNVASLSLSNLELLETDGVRIFYRIIPCAVIVKKTITREELLIFFQDATERSLNSLGLTGRLIGLNTIFDFSTEHIATQLSSLSFQKVREPIVDKFIQQHPNEIARVLGYRNMLSQKKLKWLERGQYDPDESRPDFLMERFDGYYDILDLKTGAPEMKSITKHKNSGITGVARVRFVDYVAELFAQLKDYERYFSFENNRQDAYRKYGVLVQNLKLLGLVGNYNNFDRAEVDIALGQYKDNISVLSYNELANMLRRVDRG